MVDPGPDEPSRDVEVQPMMGAGGWVWMFIWIAALMFLVWLVVRSMTDPQVIEDPGAILRARFARGEISQEEFQRALSALAGNGTENRQ